MQTTCHLGLLPQEQAKKYGERIVFEYQGFGETEWKKVSWNEFSRQTTRVSRALLSLGVKVQENIGVFSQNALPYIYTDFGSYGVRVVTIPFYATSSESQLEYVVNDADIRIIFVGEQSQYDKAHCVQGLCHTLERIIVFDKRVKIAEQDNNAMYFEDFLKLGDDEKYNAELEKRRSELNGEDLANILYTSGTTGQSKGVMLTHSQYEAALDANHRVVPVNENDRVITFLPITHIFERAWDCLCLSVGATVIINTDPHRIQKSMRETHPTCMSAVPRFWEKVYVGVQQKIEGSSPILKRIFRDALETGRKYNVECIGQCKKPSLALSLKYKLINSTVLSLVRKELGLENQHIFPTAGAFVSKEVSTFVHSIGVNMVVGYGLTESLATVTCEHPDKPYTVGAVGRPIHSIDIKIGEDNEVLLKGPTITKGYYRRDELNKDAFTEDGYFRTGDAGFMKDGELFLTERIKDLYKTSNGKYIAPQAIESKLLVDKFIEQIAIIADDRKFVSALIVPSYTLLEEYAKKHDITFTDRKELCNNKQIIAMLTERINTLQQGLAGYEQVKRFTLLTEPFTMENGELTNTLKTRRPAIIKNHAEVIERMYKE